MKIKHFLLGAAIVALMAACGGKQETVAETQTETPAIEETVAEQVQENVAEEPVAETKAPETKKQTTTKQTTTKQETKPAVDPCEATVSNFSRYVAELEAAKKVKDSGAAAQKKYKQLKAQAAEQEAKVKECASGANNAVVTSLRNKLKAMVM